MTFPQVHVDGEVWDGAAVTDFEQRVYDCVTQLVLRAGTANVPRGSATIGTASTQLLAANATRGAAEIFNLSVGGTAYGSLGTAAVAGQGFMIPPGGGRWGMPEYTGGVVYTGAIYLVATEDVAVSYWEI